MQTVNAVKKLEKYGLIVKSNIANVSHPQYWADTSEDRISWIDFGGRVECLRIRGLNDHDDMQSDYSAGVFVSSMDTALRIAKIINRKDKSK